MPSRDVESPVYVATAATVEVLVESNDQVSVFAETAELVAQVLPLPAFEELITRVSVAFTLVFQDSVAQALVHVP